LRDLPRLRDVEDEDASESQGVVYAAEESNQRLAIVIWIEQVVEAFAEGRDGIARWDVDLEQRCDPKLGIRYSSSRNTDHRLGDIGPEDIVMSLRELLRPQATSATQVDHQAFSYSALIQDLQYAGSGFEREITVTDVMNVGEVFFVPLFHIATLAPAATGEV
jgi:hypothetical protein